MNNVSALVITKAQLKLEPTSGLNQWEPSSCTPRPIAGRGTLAHNRLKGGPLWKKESMAHRAAVGRPEGRRPTRLNKGHVFSLKQGIRRCIVMRSKRVFLFLFCIIRLCVYIKFANLFWCVFDWLVGYHYIHGFDSDRPGLQIERDLGDLRPSWTKKRSVSRQCRGL